MSENKFWKQMLHQTILACIITPPQEVLMFLNQEYCSSFPERVLFAVIKFELTKMKNTIDIAETKVCFRLGNIIID